MASNCLTDQTPATLPNAHDLAEAGKALDAANRALCALQWKVQRIARGALVDDNPEYALVEGDEIPTFAHIGALYVFARDARSRLGEAARNLDTIEERLDYLDTVRAMAGERT